MKTNTPDPAAPAPFWRGAGRAWKQFWFTPADPTILGLIRICCGLIALYTLFAYTYDLQALFGRDAWYGLDLRMKHVHEAPSNPPPLTWRGQPEVASPSTPAQKQYFEEYQGKWNEPPPPPFPRDAAEAKWIDEYRAYWGSDPRRAYAVGTYDWSVWFHVTDPDAMMALHAAFILVTLLFTVGLATRVTSVLAWFAAMCYIHRSPITLFGVDTMMLIVMTYLMIGPAGAALSVDRWVSVWWRRHRFGLRQRWPWLLGSNPPGAVAEPMAAPPPVPKSVTAGFMIRLLQLHVCFIYAAAGLAKLKGETWWQGTAIWATIANFEFAPMQNPVYMYVLRTLTDNRLLLQLFLICGTYFTLFFEISYAFLIWRPRTRWLMLSMAVILHGVIGTIMGLKTFALMMLVMNMIFLPPAAVNWIIRAADPRRWLLGLPAEGKAGPPAPAAPVADRPGKAAPVGQG